MQPRRQFENRLSASQTLAAFLSSVVVSRDRPTFPTGRLDFGILVELLDMGGVRGQQSWCELYDQVCSNDPQALFSPQTSLQ
jgi:hypothetical protein